MSRMKPGPLRALFRQCASLDAIRHRLAEAKRDQAAYGRLVADLDALLAERTAQVAAGTWPPPPTAEQVRVRALFGMPTEENR